MTIYQQERRVRIAHPKPSIEALRTPMKRKLPCRFGLSREVPRVGGTAFPAIVTICLAILASSAEGQSNGRNIAIGVRASTLGVGIELAKLLSDRMAVRVGGNFMQVFAEQGVEGADFRANLKFRSFAALVDLYPRKLGSFHVSAGAVQRSDRIDVIGVPNFDGTYTLDDKEYSQSEIGILYGAIEFPSLSPYVGFGFGSPARRGWALRPVLDLGVVVGSPQMSLGATGGFPNTPLAASLTAQKEEFQKNIEKFLTVWPVISLGLSYHF